MKLGERLRSIRLARGLRLRDVAEACTASVPYMSELERDADLPGLEMLGRLAYAHHMTVLELLEPVDFCGERTDAALPRSVAALKEMSLGKEPISPDWLHLLGRIEYRGKRLPTSQAAAEIYLHLRRVLT